MCQKLLNLPNTSMCLIPNNFISPMRKVSWRRQCDQGHSLELCEPRLELTHLWPLGHTWHGTVDWTYESCGPCSLEDKSFLRRMTAFKVSCGCLSRNLCHVKWSRSCWEAQHQTTNVSSEHNALSFTFKGRYIA